MEENGEEEQEVEEEVGVVYSVKRRVLQPVIPFQGRTRRTRADRRGGAGTRSSHYRCNEQGAHGNGESVKVTFSRLILCVC